MTKQQRQTDDGKMQREREKMGDAAKHNKPGRERKIIFDSYLLAYTFENSSFAKCKKNKFSLSTPALMAFTFGLKLRTFATFLIILFCRQSIFFSRLVISAANFVLKATNLQKMPFYLWHANIFFDCKSFPCLENFLVTLMAVYRVVGWWWLSPELGLAFCR